MGGLIAPTGLLRVILSVVPRLPVSTLRVVVIMDSDDDNDDDDLNFDLDITVAVSRELDPPAKRGSSVLLLAGSLANTC